MTVGLGGGGDALKISQSNVYWRVQVLLAVEDPAGKGGKGEGSK